MEGIVDDPAFGIRQFPRTAIKQNIGVIEFIDRQYKPPFPDALCIASRLSVPVAADVTYFGNS